MGADGEFNGRLLWWANRSDAPLMQARVVFLEYVAGDLTTKCLPKIVGVHEGLCGQSYHLFGMDSSPSPGAGGGFGAWLLEASSGALAGAIEEPVFVGLLVLLWPRWRARTFVPLALLSGVVRAGIHLYYASGVARVGMAWRSGESDALPPLREPPSLRPCWLCGGVPKTASRLS